MKTQMSRRGFLRNASLGAGVTGAPAFAAFNPISAPESRLPREIWIGATSLFGLQPEATIENRVRRMLARMKELEPYKPDIVCIPETFQTMWVDEHKPLSEIAEQVPGPLTERMAEFARRNSCYVICAIETKEGGRFYNSAILLDRAGAVSGIYHKAHPTITEVAGGTTPGTLDVPVFKTDFGTIGIQICYDLNWQDGWRKLKEKGAEIVFFPSAFPGGSALDSYAWFNHYYIVSATGRDARIIDIGGVELAASGQFAGWVCGPVNLEKVFVHIWPHVLKFGDIEAKYGRKIRINILHPEDTATIESRDPEVRVMDVLREFDIPTYDEHIRQADEAQNRKRV